MAQLMNEFKNIATIYDRFNDLSLYEEWLTFTLAHLDGPGYKVLDAACGTGYFTRMLAPFTKEIHGFDRDLAMLAANSDSINEPLMNGQFFQADMLDLKSLASDYDLVTCYADSLCFLVDELSLRRALDQLYQRLVPGGLLLFDVWTPYQLTDYFADFSYHDQDDRGALLWDSQVDASQLRVQHQLTYYEQSVEDPRMYQRLKTTLIERTYPMSTYLTLLQAVGFKSSRIKVTCDFSLDAYSPDQDKTAARWFFACYKEED